MSRGARWRGLYEAWDGRVKFGLIENAPDSGGQAVFPLGQVARKQGDIVLKAILTDSHFWIPLGVLVIGIVLLVFLR